jgi:hypothetical protein
MTAARGASTTAGDPAVDDLQQEFGDRWQITPITGGYRAIPRQAGGHTSIPRYGRTPDELAESIRMMEDQP